MKAYRHENEFGDATDSTLHGYKHRLPRNSKNQVIHRNSSIPDSSSQLFVFECSPYHIINVGIQVVIEHTKREHCTSSLPRVRLKTVWSLAYPVDRTNASFTGQ